MDEDLKKCSKCKMECLKLNFYKDITRKDGLRIYCKSCTNQHHNNRKEQRNAYEKQKRKTDLNFKLASYMRNRLYKAYISQNLKKTNKTIDLVGCSLEFFKKWILHQLSGEMTEENYGKIWCLDHCFPLSKTNLSDQNEVNKSTNWINLRPMYCSENISKGNKIDHRLYLMQEIKANYFTKLNGQEGLN